MKSRGLHECNADKFLRLFNGNSRFRIDIYSLSAIIISKHIFTLGVALIEVSCVARLSVIISVILFTEIHAFNPKINKEQEFHAIERVT